MSKRTLSLLLCFVIVLSVMAVVPVKAVTYLQTQLKVIPDKTTVAPGDVINYTVVMGPVSDLGSLQMELVIPEGLTYKPGTGKITDGLMEEMGFDALDWTEESLIINGGASAADYNSDKSTILGTFSCTVDEDFCGTVAVDLTYLEFYSCQTWEEHTERFNVVSSEITVGVPDTSDFAPATEILYAGIKLNAETPYLLEDPNDDTVFKAIASATDSAAGYELFATFDAETGTLTYNNGFELKTVSGMAEANLGWNSYALMAVPEGETTRYGIKANGSLTVDLNGFNNALYATWTGDIEHNNVIAIYADGDVTIKGKGFLRLTANASKNHTSNSHSIYAKGNINLLGGIVYAYVGNLDSHRPVNGAKSEFFHAEGNIYLDGGTMKIRTLMNADYSIKYNKTPIYNADDYTVSEDRNLAIQDPNLLTNPSHGDVRASNSFNNPYNISYNYGPRYTVTFNTNGGSTIEPVKATMGTSIDLAQYITTKDENTFMGWYSDAALTKAVTSVVVEKNITLYAKWKGAAVNATEIVFAGQKLNSSKPYLYVDTTDSEGGHRKVSAYATRIDASDKILLAEFDAETATLTFKYGFEKVTKPNTLYPEIDTGRIRPVYSVADSKYYGIKAEGHLTIDLGTYNNAFKWNWNDIGSNMNVIDVAGNLTIKGNGGHLGIHAVPGTDVSNDSDPYKYSGAHHTNGIRVDGNVAIEGGEVYIYARPYQVNSDDTSTFINAGGTITLNGGKLKLRGQRGMTAKPVLTNTKPILIGNYTVEENVNECLEEGEGRGLGFVHHEEGGQNLWNKTYIPEFTVAFEENGAGTVLSDVTAAYGEKIDFSEYIPRKVNATFAGWYSDAEFTKKITTLDVYNHTTVYAKWEPSPSEYYATLNGGETVKNGSNTVEVKLSKTPAATNESVVIIVSVYENSTVGGKKVERLKECKSVTKQISELTQPVQINVDANAQDAVDVFIWKDGKTLKVVQEQFAFGR